MALSQKITGKDIAELLKGLKGVEVKEASATSLVLLVEGDRIPEMQRIARFLSSLGAKIDPNLKVSREGGIVVDNIKILLKPRVKTAGLKNQNAAAIQLESALLAALAEAGGTIKIKLNNKLIQGVAQVITTVTPNSKSDFYLADAKGKALVHISHKDGRSPRDLQQWADITEDKIVAHPEVKEFVKKCKTKYAGAIPRGEAAYASIKSKDLSMMAVFGVNWDRGGTDTNKIDVVIQGTPGLKKVSKGETQVYELTSTGNIYSRGEIPNGGFTPVLTAIHKSGRGQFDIKDSSFSIYPQGGSIFKTRLD